MAEDFQMVAEAMLMAFAESVDAADVDGLAELFWLDDQRLAAIGDAIAEPFGRAALVELLASLHAQGQPGDATSWRDVRAHRLGPDVGYVIARQRRGDTWAWATLILLKKGREWGLLHCSFAVPLRRGQG